MKTEYLTILSVIALFSPFAAQAQIYERLHDFQKTAGFSMGYAPGGGLVQGPGGFLYGTTAGGGERDGVGNTYGTLFKISLSGSLAHLADFTGTAGATRGEQPQGELILYGDGNFYGTTFFGGLAGDENGEPLNLGTIFRVSPMGVVTNLVSFTGNGSQNKGAHPAAGLVLGSDGNFYGTTRQGGSSDLGTVFRLTPAGTLTTIAHFTGNGPTNKGSHPECALVRGNDGRFYGTTSAGGSSGFGTIFRISTSGSLDTLVEFTGNGATNKGRSPRSALLQGIDGNLYGTTSLGGASNFGTVFRVTQNGELATLVEFTGDGGPHRGREPGAALVFGINGSLYGTTRLGGAQGRGTAFSVTTSGNFSTLAEFGGSNNGSYPISALLRASDGNFYGTTSAGGREDSGTVFRMTPDGVVTTYDRFRGYTFPIIGYGHKTSIIDGEDGYFYGTSWGPDSGGNGSIFRLATSGVLTTLVEFTNNGATNKGRYPKGGLVRGSNGYLYGTTAAGGETGHGTVYRTTPTGVLTTLVEFSGNTGANKGRGPEAALVEGSDGNFYGTTLEGGAHGFGTVFRMTPEGSLTTLVEFTGNETTNKGAAPVAALMVNGTDGNFYGTTRAGGANNLGTVFRMTPSGNLTTLVQFTDNGTSNKGQGPRGALVRGNDGKLYGTTFRGGTNGMGTVFRMTTAGALETLVSFSSSGDGGVQPAAGLVQAPDGNFYGTTYGNILSSYGSVFRMTPSGVVSTLVTFTESSTRHPETELVIAGDGNLYGTTYGNAESRFPGGTIFRMLVPGRPSVAAGNVFLEGEDAEVEVVVNPRGFPTAVTMEYGTEPNNLTESKPVAFGTSGFQSHSFSAYLVDIPPGTTYYFRFIATNSSGTSISPTESFTTTPVPDVTVAPATNVASFGATLQGSVNPRGHFSTANFEWGIDGESFPSWAPVAPSPDAGTIPVSVSTPIADLTKGTTYYFRVVATNAGGTSVSGTQSFRTLTEPVATIGAFTVENSSRVKVEGAVNPEGSETTVDFEYWPTGEEGAPRSSPASPRTVSGQGGTSVSAVLSNLQQGVTYHYRIRATSSENLIGFSATASFFTEFVSGTTRQLPATLQNGHSLTVNLFPGDGGLRGWRFSGEQEWRSSGEEVHGLSGGDRLIEFRPSPGYLHPPSEVVDFDGVASSTVLDRQYFETDGLGIGKITVTLKPDSIAGPGHAQWRLLGEGPGDWRDSGVTLVDLISGAYLIEFKPVAGRGTPPNSSVVVDSAPVSLTVTYAQAIELQANPPSALDFETVEGDPGASYSFVGQIRSTAGAGTGFGVKERVVATAAHVVWDDVTLSAAQGLQWLHQRHRGDYEPEPLAPRGFYLLDGYAAKRLGENSPGNFSLQSRNLDVAAMYFTGPDALRLGYAARGGYGGYLGSDLDDNEFLLSNANKVLLGYPVDGIAPENRGRMHASSPVDVAFTKVGPEANRTFLTTVIRSSGGASGGPLCVQESGIYYPAAIYLGGSDQTIVRSIDSDVVRLFNLAQAHSLDPNGNVGGGISLTGSNLTGSSTSWGGLRVNLSPPAVANAGAGWRLRPEKAYRASGARRDGLNPGLYRLEFSDVPGYQTPPMQVVGVVGGQATTLTFTYAPAAPSAAKVAVRGKGRNIANGDIAPSALDGSDFGLVALDGGTATRTFTISNPGTAALSLGSVVVGGTHPDDFSVSIPPGPSVPPGGSTSFTLLFDPSATGARSATVSFATNVSGSNPFTFAIQGNDETDSNSDGFSNVEESSLAELLASFAVGQSVNLDLSFLRLGDGQILALLNLPPGLSFDPATRRITGTIAGKGASPQVEVRKLDGASIVSTVTMSMPVVFPAKVAVTRAKSFPATRVGRRSRPQTLRVRNDGEMTLTQLSAKASGKTARDFLLTRPAASLAPGGSTSVKVVFRPRGKGMRRASVTIFSNTEPRSVPVSGRGR